MAIDLQLLDSAGPSTFGIVTPKPFVLAEQNDSDLERLKNSIMEERVVPCEDSMSNFYGSYGEIADSWRVRRSRVAGKPKNLFNSKVGETHRATETLATFFYRVATSSDMFYEAVARGLNWNNTELTQTDLYATEQVIWEQLIKTQYKRKLLNASRSVSLFGTVICEEPWIQRPIVGTRHFEGTDFVPLSLLQVFFDTSVPDIEWSDFIAVAAYYTKNKILDMAKNDSEKWDLSAVEECLNENYSSTNKDRLGVLERIKARKNRAGYADPNTPLHELLTYHGRVDTENSVIASLWESLGPDVSDLDPKHTDFTVRILNGNKIVSIEPTQFGNWRTRFRIAHYKSFELEPLGYGVGQIGRKAQKEMDVTQSRANDLLMMALYNMWKVSKYAGVKQSQLTMKPLSMIELEDISQLDTIKPDVNAVAHAINVLAGGREDFRATTGAMSTLQAVLTNATATESGIAQNEAMRSAGVHGELIAETLVREHLEQCHINNLAHLDSEIWVALTGEDMSEFMPYNKYNLPSNVGFKVKITTDKDFRPDRLQKILQAIQIATSVRNTIPINMNFLMPLIQEAFRSLGLSPRLLMQPNPLKEQMEQQMLMSQKDSKINGELSGEVGDEMYGNTNMKQTPIGLIPTSPLPPNIQEMSA